MMLWVIDSYDIEQFVAKSHEAHFTLKPKEALVSRMRENGSSEAEIEVAIKNGDVVADWMTAEELASVIEKIAAMKRYFATYDPGPFAQALVAYATLGAVVRGKFIQQYGYAPEHSAVPRVKIRGEESEKKKLQPSEHQPPLF